MKRAFGRGALATAFVAALTSALAAALPTDSDAQGRNLRGAKPQAAAGKAAGPLLDRTRGAAEAPAVVQAAGLGCTVSDAAFLGQTKTAAGVVHSNYEVACREGLGYLLQTGAAGTPPKFYDCLVTEASVRAAEAKGPTTALRCRLPANAQPALSLQPLVARAGGACTVTNGRYVGSLQSSGATVYEVSCAQGSGFLLERPASTTAAPKLTSCLAAAGTPSACTLTTQAQLMASLAPVVAQAQRQCTPSNVRVAGRSQANGNEVLEIGCEAGRPGFLLELNKTGGFVRALDCDRVAGVPCKLTDTATLEAAGREALLQRVRSANLPGCTPSNVRLIGTETPSRREVVEVACSDRAFGALVVLPAPGSSFGPEVHDCLLAPRWAGQCQLSQVSAVYPRVSSALRLRGRSPNCQINNARWMGVTPQGENWFEIACADGRSFLMDYRSNGQVASMLTCREGAAVGGGCRAGIGASVPKN